MHLVFNCNRKFPKALSRAPLAGLALPVLAAGFTHFAVAQTLPTGAGLRIGDSAIPALGPRRGFGQWVTETSFTTQATLTNNANYGNTGTRQGDLILEFVPAINFDREGGRFRVNGNVALDFLGYVDGTQVSSILPSANIAANLEAIENFFFVDASLFAGQSVLNPYLPSSAASTNNLYTTTQASLAPYIAGNLGQEVRWQVRSDNSYTWTSKPDDPLGNAYYVHNLAEVNRVPVPFGWTLRLTNDLTRQQNQVQPDQTLNTALAVFYYAFSPQFTFGLRGGYENTTYTALETAGPIYGGDISWHPSPLSSLAGFWQQRFYGPNYQFVASHRQRRVASSASFYRTITTYPQVLFQVPATNNVSGLLSAILEGRFPDPAERAREVDDLVARQALPQALPAGAYIYNQSANILTGGNVGWTLLGIRNTLTLNVFYLKTALLPDPRVPPTFLVFNDNIQQGGGISLGHTLTPVISLSGSLSSSYTRGFGPSEGLNSRQNLIKLQSNLQLSPRSTLFLGAFYENSASNSVGALNDSQAAAFVGLFHRL
jgi:uncharacterized protein (PEP-CTERM system associated)